MRLYKRLLRVADGTHISDDEVLCELRLPSPTEQLRRSRLRYLATLMQIGTAACWGLPNQDSTWLKLLQDDLPWMWHRLSNSSELGDPALHIARWLEVMQHHRPYWRRFVHRAGQHAMNQRLKTFKCQQFYLGMRSILRQNDMWPHQHAPPKPDHARDSHLPFGCMSCQRSFRSLGSEGAHMFRTHGEVQPVRFLFESMQCAACLREYYTHGKMKLHLLRSQGCRANLIGHGGRHAPVPGLGSDEDRRRHRGCKLLAQFCRHQELEICPSSTG